LLLTVHQAKLTIALEAPEPDSGRRRGILSGVLDPDELSSALWRFQTFYFPEVCNDAACAEIARSVDIARDLPARPSRTEAGDPGRGCAVVSFGMGFTFRPVILGGVAAPEEPPPDPCAPS
jgi:hypothetical protein